MTKLWALALLLGCTPRPLDPSSVRTARMRSSSQCARHELSDASPYHLALAGPVEDPSLRGWLEQVPVDVRRTVLATGLEPLLAGTLRGCGERSLEQLERRQQLSTRLSALDSQLSALLFESDCTGDALNDLGNELERQEHQRELRLTVASLVVGAAFGVAAAVYQAKDHDGSGPAILGGVGAGSTALLGLAAFWPNDRPAWIRHERNLLRPILRGEDPDHIYPSFVFRLLTLPMPDGSLSPRDELLSRWRAELPNVEAERLLFGDGGLYPPALLQLRQTMLDQLESHLNAITREVELLERYILRATSGDETLAEPTKPLSGALQ